MSGKVLHFEPNQKGRDLVVGDIHGCMNKLRVVMKAAEFNPAVDRLFSVGDLCDRGPDSVRALALLDEPWFHAVKGNHEDMLAGVVLGGWDIRNYFSNGGEWIQSCSKEYLEAMAAKVRALPLAIVVGAGMPGRFNVLHAEFFGTDADLDAGNFGEREEMQILWGRSLILGRCDPPTGLSRTFVGHTIRPIVQRIGPLFFMDTGSFLGDGRITIIEPASETAWDSRA